MDETQDDRSNAIETDRSLFPLLIVVSRTLATTSSTLIFWLLELSSVYIYPPSTYIYCFFHPLCRLECLVIALRAGSYAWPPSSNCGPSTSVKLLKVLSTW